MKFFHYVDYNPTQIWFDSVDCSDLLGSTLSNFPILYRPSLQYCATIDGIIVNQAQSKVDFLQVTVSSNQPVSPRGFLAMFLLVKLLEFSYNKEFSVNFYFVVPEENFNSFVSTEAIYLHYIFNKIQVYVSTIIERNSTPSEISTTPSQISTSPSQISTSPSKNQIIPEGIVYLYLNPFQLSNLNLKLTFNNGIICDFCNASVSILEKKFSINGHSAPNVCSNGKIPFVTNDLNTNSLELKLFRIEPKTKNLLDIYSKICFLFQKKKKMNIEEELESEYKIFKNIQDNNTKSKKVKKKIETKVDLSGERSCQIKINKNFVKDNTDVYIFLSCLNLQFDNINIDDDGKENFKTVFLKFKSKSFNSNINLLQKLNSVFSTLKDTNRNNVIKLENYYKKKKKERKKVDDTNEESENEEEDEDDDLNEIFD
jgi:hypothetical protein